MCAIYNKHSCARLLLLLLLLPWPAIYAPPHRNTDTEGILIITSDYHFQVTLTPLIGKSSLGIHRDLHKNMINERCGNSRKRIAKIPSSSSSTSIATAVRIAVSVMLLRWSLHYRHCTYVMQRGSYEIYDVLTRTRSASYSVRVVHRIRARNELEGRKETIQRLVSKMVCKFIFIRVSPQFSPLLLLLTTEQHS